MTRVKLGGRELTVADEHVTEYLAKGYSVIDSKGKAVAFGGAPSYDTVAAEAERLKEENIRLRKSNEALAEQNSDLEKKLGEAMSKLKKLETKAAKAEK